MAQSDAPFTRAAAGARAPSMLDRLFAGGSTVVFLAIVASLVGSLSAYFR